ncbi:MAG: hypothetical protein HY881_01530 [Deltaproteobacteria bacterium]|nr:hypothetical protein [Deltaproteobacteria bacterium]
MWIHGQPKAATPKVPASIKAEIQQKADQLVETTLKPQHLKPPPVDSRFNYIVDIYTRWYRHSIYFCAKYFSPGPNALSPNFETKFARLEYVGENRFNLSFMRHTGQWIEIYPNLSLDKCLEAIKDDPAFFP